MAVWEFSPNAPPTPLVSTGFNTFHGHSPHESTRWCAAAIPLGPQGAPSRCFLHLISFYGIANRAQGAKRAQNERLLDQVFEHAFSLGQQAILIGMDANANTLNSLNRFWRRRNGSILLMFSAMENRNPPFAPAKHGTSSALVRVSPGQISSSRIMLL